jgi:hypothetical protein
VSDDLISFVRARLDEDEAAARDAAPFYADRDLVAEMVEEGFDAEVPEHAQRHDPARALREVAAKRAILVMYADARWDLAREDVVRELAAVWSDHADYRQEWAP